MKKGHGLVLSRKLNETIKIGNDIVITIAYINGKRVGLAINAPDEINIVRGEVSAKHKVTEAVA